MGSVPITQGLGAAAATWNVFRLLVNSPDVPTVKGPWRPPQWQMPQLTSVSAMLPRTSSSTVINFGNGQTQSSPGTTTYEQVIYFFDAVLRADHDQELTPTQHPVQTGANLVDHAFLRPARVTLEIGMSDVLDRYASGSYTSNASKSVSAFQVLENLQQMRIPLTVQTRLKTYYNMLIQSIRAIDTKETRYGLRAYVTFIQIFTAEVSTQVVSARPDQSQNTSEGTKQPEDVPEPLAAAHEVHTATNIPGAGNFSSHNIPTGASSSW